MDNIYIYIYTVIIYIYYVYINLRFRGAFPSKLGLHSLPSRSFPVVFKVA